mmetsp:Transcript_8972/g.21339  ORF Transcript_8972/g.21339 Transcript_8972/m.21339 type:complete len:109 (-) Transcript_8972:102-428(-)
MLIMKQGKLYRIQLIKQRYVREWHSNSDLTARRLLCAAIMRELRRRKPNASEEVKQRFPKVTKRMEHFFYFQASSKEQYSNLSTLAFRMERFATMVLQRARRLQQRGT